ncbi:MAG: hypothetical protein ACTSYU_01955 [Promethearchaeota archaeon]
MRMDEDYQDFRAFVLKGDGEKEEIEAEMDNISALFSSEGVYLFVRYDLRRIYIWKGPKSPVRKRFISSRVGSKIQEASSKIGMHLKIVSVDAGDEPIEFLRNFKIESYKVSDEEKLEDMVYLRNAERVKLEEEQFAKDLAPKKEEEEYWSPVLEQQKREDKMKKAKEKAVKTTQEIASSIGKPATKKVKHIPIKKKKHSSYLPSRSSGYGRSSSTMSKDAEKEILNLILESEPLDEMKRMNIIIGNSVYSPKRTISTLFGKEVEEVQWARMENIPDGNIDIDSHLLRVYCKDNQIQGMEIFQANGKAKKQEKSKPEPKKQPTKKKATPKKKTSAKKNLKTIPKG